MLRRAVTRAGLLAAAVVLACAPALLREAPATAASARDDGRYAGTHAGNSTRVTFTVSGRGRRLVNLKTHVSAFCVGPTLETNRFTTLEVFVARARISRSGRFSGRSRPASGTEIEYRGTLRRRRVRDGHVEIKVSTCSGSADWTARRVGR